MATTVEKKPQTSSAAPRIDRVVTLVSAGALIAFVGAAISAPDTVGSWVNRGFSTSARWFGLF